MPRQRKAVVAVGPDGTETRRYESTYQCQLLGLARNWVWASCEKGNLYRGVRYMWANEYDKMVQEGRTAELSYGRQKCKPIVYRRRIAFTYDYRGPDDDQLMFLFKGATIEMLDDVFGLLCNGTESMADGYHIQESHDLVRLWRHNYYRIEVWLEGYHPQFASLHDCLVIITQRLRVLAGGDVDLYKIDDWLNLTDRNPDAILSAWQEVKSPTTEQTKKKPVKQKSRANKDSHSIDNNNQEDMPKMYVRVPSYVAGFFRGRNEDKQLTAFDPYEFPDHDDLMLFMEHHLRFIPEQNQNVFCLSERAFNHILHGKQPGGGQQMIDRNPEQWPSVKEFCTLTGKFVTDKQEAADYLCIAIPKEILDGGRLHRTNGSYTLPKREADKFISYLRQEFKRELEAFCEVDEMVCLENGINRSDVDRMERFLANYNIPISVDAKDRESLRKLMFRIRKRKNIQPYLRKKLDSFAQHISEEDLQKAERRSRKIEKIKIKKQKT